MTLKRRILIGYGVAFTLMALVVAWAVANLVSLGKATDAILSENYRSILAAENMVDVLERQDSGILIMLLGDPGKGIAQFRDNEADFLEWLARAKDNITIQGEAEIVQSIEADYAGYRQQFSTLTEIRHPSKTSQDPPIAIYEESVQPLFEQVRDLCVELRHLNEETMYAASLTARTVATRAIWSTAIVAASALIVALIFSFLLAGRIVRPIRQFMEASRKISSGDYTVQIPVETGDELGHLAGEFNAMAEQLGRYNEMNIDQIIAEKNKGEAILSSIEDGLVVFDTALKVVGINPSARRVLDLEFSESSSLHCMDILPDQSIRDLVRSTIETGAQPDVPDEQRIVSLPSKQGTRHFLISVTGIRGRDRTLTGALLLLRDVTRMKEVERLKSEFVMAASHELRTPLTSLGMSVDLLLEHVAPRLGEKERELLGAAHEEVNRMKTLVNDLLDLSRIEAGKIDLEFETVPVSTLFQHVDSVFRSQMDMKDLTLETTLQEGLVPVRADANKITWVLSNLVSNALRYVSKGGHIELSAQKIGPHVRVAVRDDGSGIPAEYQSKIFQKFVQVKGREGGGTGLGLAICKEIVRAHGGAIWVESVPGRGSTFTFTLPVA
ncbi:MAG: cell wall metabolism sensor histidine kinase WalK [Candidatus Eisenbacteria bacterium]|uniref:histidine kinase n=1 Tax=Eiseniibacteriota bacterium TaxID=2212470 RepID=A0A948W947_UNCEI|nr:cell wall metabolism sensor histidine kinase WalK [Candidatus Eisenbacteria bacterium]MBU1947425.1 cell wall metabolism sensor histidine kinase WalK [Candidatus Eisenbacteria bacterium]MBU2693386.1 cell wall metabolism sensor histidine kinase WalK [Candidatus Eisenbacteria bacterium]